MIEIAVVGLGSWGLCVLERIVTGARRRGRHNPPTRVHVIEPAAPGAGVYGETQPDYLLMNNACGQLSMYPDPTPADQPRYGLGLYDWAHARGYRWDRDACRVGDGREITPDDYLPRRVMAEYLQWFYRALVADAPPTLEIVYHACAALDIVPQPGHREGILLANGSRLIVDHVILTSGHTANSANAGVGEPAIEVTSPYPVQRYVDTMPNRATVGVSGMGLVAADVVTALTVGRGGHFVDDGARKRYVRSGREPAIFLASRSGLPYCAKAVAGVDQTGEYQPEIATAEALAALSASGDASQPRAFDIRADFLPLMFAEMQLRYHEQSARLADGPAVADQVRRRLVGAWHDGGFPAAIDGFETRYGQFDAARHFFGDWGHNFVASRDYETHVYGLIERDVDESLMPGGSSPVKCAYEVFRIMRDSMRSAVEFGGISLESYVDFQEKIRNRVHRLIAGPPVLRSQQLLGLIDAGIVSIPFGPSPTIEADGSAALIRSEALERPHSQRVDYLIQGHLEDPTVHRSASPLLARLYESGRIQQFHYGDVAVGSINLTRDFHPVSISGEIEERIWIFGVLTEGIRYFNHYIPSPKSRIRAFVDVQTCVDRIAC